MTSESSGIVWRPTKEHLERSRIARFMKAQGIGTLEELQKRSVADLEWYWDAVVKDLGVRWTTPYSRVLDDSRGIEWPTWFRRPRRQARHHLGRRRWPDPHAELRRAGRRGESAGQRAEGARRRRGRPRRHLPADVAGGGDRHAGRGEDRRHLHALLLGLRRRCRRLAAVGLRGQGADHGRRLLSARPGREDEGGRRRGRRPVPVGEDRARVSPAGSRPPVDGGP